MQQKNIIAQSARYMTGPDHTLWMIWLQKYNYFQNNNIQGNWPPPNLLWLHRAVHCLHCWHCLTVFIQCPRVSRTREEKWGNPHARHYGLLAWSFKRFLQIMNEREVKKTECQKTIGEEQWTLSFYSHGTLERWMEFGPKFFPLMFMDLHFIKNRPAVSSGEQ